MPSLREYLQKHFENKIEDLQKYGYKGNNPGVENTVDGVVNDLVNPNGNPYSLVGWASARMNEVSDQLSERVKEDKVSPLVMPRLGALSVEWMFELCVLYWISKGDPPQSNQLDPKVKKFIARQAKIAAALMGDRGD